MNKKFFFISSTITANLMNSGITGGEVRLAEIMRGFIKDGWEVHFLTNGGGRLFCKYFALLYTLLPVIPQKVMDLIIKRKWYDKIKNISNIFFVLAKIISRLSVGQIYLYTSEIKRISWFIYSVLKTKWSYRNVRVL